MTKEITNHQELVLFSATHAIQNTHKDLLRFINDLDTDPYYMVNGKPLPDNLKITLIKTYCEGCLEQAEILANDYTT